MPERTVTIRYFAILRERRGLDREPIITSAETLLELYQSLDLGLDSSLVRFAVGGEFVSPSTPVVAGMEVALIPPVAGG